MLGLIVVTFFAATGFMFNHEEWFGYAEPHTVTHHGIISPALLTWRRPMNPYSHFFN